MSHLLPPVACRLPLQRRGETNKAINTRESDRSGAVLDVNAAPVASVSMDSIAHGEPWVTDVRRSNVRSKLCTDRGLGKRMP